MAQSAILYDGQSADRHIVTIAAESGLLMIRGETVATDRLDPAMLRADSLDANSDRIRVGHKDRDGWRLIIPLPIEAEILEMLPKGSRYGAWVDRYGLGKMSVALAGITALVLAAGYTAPKWLAPLVPSQWEENVGNALVGDLGASRCESEEAEAVLAAMVARLDAEAGKDGLEIKPAIIDIPIFNAAALPGGHIVIFDGALDRDVSGDALAGIIAHEIAHVRERHVAEALIREFGIGAVVRLFGGDIGATAQQLVALSYTRDNEHEADVEAIAMLDDANISPLDTGKLFDRFKGRENRTTSFLDSHPLSGDRARDFSDAHEEGRDYDAAFTRDEMRVLRAACGRRAMDNSESENE